MGYDDWKTETDLDYHERMGTHRRGESSLPPAAGGTCACGAETLRSMAGVGWQCHACGELALRQQFPRWQAEEDERRIREQNEATYLRAIEQWFRKTEKAS